MRRHAHADRLLARQAPRHFAARAQDEGVAARRRALHQLELRVVDDGVLGHLREVAAHQRQVVALVDRPDAAQALEPFRVRRDRSPARSRNRSDRRSRRRGARCPPPGGSAASADGSGGWRRIGPSAREEFLDQARHRFGLIVVQHVPGVRHADRLHIRGRRHGARRSALRSGAADCGVSDSAPSTHNTGARDFLPAGAHLFVAVQHRIDDLVRRIAAQHDAFARRFLAPVPREKFRPLPRQPLVALLQPVRQRGEAFIGPQSRRLAQLFQPARVALGRLLGRVGAMPKPSRLTKRATRAGRTPAYSAATLPPRLWPTRLTGASGSICSSNASRSAM